MSRRDSARRVLIYFLAMMVPSCLQAMQQMWWRLLGEQVCGYHNSADGSQFECEAFRIQILSMRLIIIKYGTRLMS